MVPSTVLNARDRDDPARIELKRKDWLFYLRPKKGSIHKMMQMPILDEEDSATCITKGRYFRLLAQQQAHVEMQLSSPLCLLPRAPTFLLLLGYGTYRSTATGW